MTSFLAQVEVRLIVQSGLVTVCNIPTKEVCLVPSARADNHLMVAGPELASYTLNAYWVRFYPGFDAVRHLLPEATPIRGRRAWPPRLRSRFCARAGVLALGAARPQAPAAGWGLTCLPFPGVCASWTAMADAWEEIRRLAADFQRAQFAEAAQRCWSPPVWSRLRPGTLPHSRSGRRASAGPRGPAAVAAGRGARSPA